MDQIKAQLLKIQQQLAGLSATQKMLTASLLAIMLITLVWWTRSAGTSDMEPVIPSAMSSAEAIKAQGSLKAAGIDSTLSGGQVLVAADQKSAAVGVLAADGTMPNEANPADELLKLIGPLDSNSKIQLTKDATLEVRLAHAFTSFFPNVQKAVVMLNTKDERRIGAPNEPSASVIITTKKNQAGNVNLLAASVANVISRAVNNLQQSKVAVVIDGKKMRTDDATDDMSSADADERIMKWERHYEDDIRGIVGENALVMVKAELDDVATHTEAFAGDPNTTLSKEARSEQQTMESHTGAGPTGEPGAVPNSSVALPSASASATPQTSTTTEKNSSENTIYLGRTETKSDKRGGGMRLKTASVRVPLSALVSSWKHLHSTTKEPGEAELETFIKTQLDQAKSLVLNGLALTQPDSVAMGVLYDAPTETSQTPEVAAIAPTSMMSGYGKQAILGLLAVGSLFMVATMVKKGTPAPAIPMAAAPMTERGPMTLSALGELAGIVSDDASGTLEGIELDEYQIKTSRVVAQVSDLVKENPEAAADLVKRWMSRT